MSRLARQRGTVLFVALIALVAIMLAAVALTRSVDTSTVISGNIAFKQAALTSADSGLEAAVNWLATTSASNSAKDVWTDTSHAFNTTDAADGYYSVVHSDTSFVTSDSTWTDAASKNLGADVSGNTVRYIIERMCRTGATTLNELDCLFSDAESDTGSHRVKTAQDAGAKITGKIPMNRVTVRVSGPRNTVSYIQAFVY